MKKLVIMAGFLSFSSFASASQVHGKFSEKPQPKKALSTLISEKSTDKVVTTEGVVKQVCEKKGCWMTLEEGGQSVRVFFKGYSFFVGKDLVGKRVKAEGKLLRKTQSVAEQQHLLEDGGATKAEIEKVKEPLDTFTFEASAVAAL